MILYSTIMDYFNLIALVATLCVSLQPNTLHAQEQCIFGYDDDCYFPCHCPETTPNISTCDVTTGSCYSTNCQTWYYIRQIGEYRTCQPNFRKMHSGSASDSTRVGVYLLDPVTLQRMTPDLYEIFTHFYSRTEDYNPDCSDFIDPDLISGLNETMILEVDLLRLHTLKRDIRFYLDDVPINYASTVEFDFGFRNTMDDNYTAFYNESCSKTSSGSYIRCDSDDTIQARYIAITADVMPQPCFLFQYLYLESTSLFYSANIDCDHCLQNDASPCGNGYWCEQCAQGWKPPDCRQPCDPGYHGINCLETYDWSGSVSARQVDDVMLVQLHCETDIPEEFESHYSIRVEQLFPITSIQLVPFSRDDVTVAHPMTDGDVITLRFVLVGVFGNRTVVGQPSERLSLFATNEEDNNDKDDNNNNNSVLLYGIIAAGALVVVCVAGLVVMCVLLAQKRNKPARDGGGQTELNLEELANGRPEPGIMPQQGSERYVETVKSNEEALVESEIPSTADDKDGDTKTDVNETDLKRLDIDNNYANHSTSAATPDKSNPRFSTDSGDYLQPNTDPDRTSANSRDTLPDYDDTLVAPVDAGDVKVETGSKADDIELSDITVRSDSDPQYQTTVDYVNGEEQTLDVYEVLHTDD